MHLWSNKLLLPMIVLYHYFQLLLN